MTCLHACSFHHAAPSNTRQSTASHADIWPQPTDNEVQRKKTDRATCIASNASIRKFTKRRTLRLPQLGGSKKLGASLQDIRENVVAGTLISL